MGEVRAVTDSEYESSVNDSEWVLETFGLRGADLVKQ